MAKTSRMNEQWADRGDAAMRVSAVLSVLALIGVLLAHAPVATDLSNALVSPASATTTIEAPFDYFPAHYQLNAPADEPAVEPSF